MEKNNQDRQQQKKTRARSASDGRPALVRYPSLAALSKKGMQAACEVVPTEKMLQKMQEFTFSCAVLVEFGLCGSQKRSVSTNTDLRRAECAACHRTHDCLFHHGMNYTHRLKSMEHVQRCIRKSDEELCRIAARSNMEVITDLLRKQLSSVMAAVNRAEKNMDPSPVADSETYGDAQPQVMTHEDALERAELSRTTTFADLAWQFGITQESMKKTGVPGNINEGWFNPHLLSRYNITGAELTIIPGVDADWLVSNKVVYDDLCLLSISVKELLLFFNLKLDHIRDMFITPDQWIQLGLTKNTLTQDLACNLSQQFFTALVSHERTHKYRWTANHLLKMGFTTTELTNMGFVFWQSTR